MALIKDSIKMYGWWNKVAKVDLKTEKVTTEKIGEKKLHRYIGGRGLGARLLLDEINPKSEKIEDNVLIFTAGPLTATSVPTSGRFSVTSISPLTGTIFDSNVGGYFGKEFKNTGFDAMVVSGKADRPVKIKVQDQQIDIEKTDLWGTKTGEALDSLADKSAVIGPAGEKEVPFANIVTNDDRVFGRGGMGAVMGSKNLKAITVKGTKEVPVADEEKTISFVKKASTKIDSSPVTSKGLRKFGTPILVNLLSWMGMFPIRNFQEAKDERADNLSGEVMREETVDDHYGCYACPIRCGLKTQTSGKEGKGPEYESVWSLGANLGIFDLEEVTEANYLCNELGLDTISTGGTLATGMEMSENGIWDEIEGFGEDDIKDLIHKIAYQKGVGKKLAEGSSDLCERYDCELSMSVKGMELPAYDPRGAAGQALSFATSNRGGCHLRGYMIGEEIFGVPKLFDRFKTNGKPQIVKRSQERNAYLDSLILCKFSSFALEEEFYSRFLRGVTGIDYTVNDLHTIGERIYNLEREFNSARGFERKDDRLPDRFSNPLEDGASAGNTFDMEKLLDEYYEVMGWDQQGRPKTGTLQRLDVPELR